MKSVSGVTFIKELKDVQEYRLEKNGLRILLAPDATLPVAGCMVTYHVGSRNEAIGYTGATHLLEHLMFKGSKNFNKEDGTTIWHVLETKGALVNATTWNDRTNYYEVVPKEHLGIAITLEADRMRTARIEEADRKSEMTVVRNEFERGENMPMEALDKQIWALAYQAHPYHHSTIGWRSDIESVPIERLKQFYDAFYWPNNATVTIVGAFDEGEILELIKEEFGKHTSAPHEIEEPYTTEPIQEGQRRAIVRRAGVGVVGVAHKTPEAAHADMPALTILATILGEGNTSRLYRALVDSAKAIDVMTVCYQFRDPGLFMTYATLAPKVLHADIEALIQKEYAKIASGGVTSAELARAKRAARAYVAERRDGPYALLSSLNEEISTGDWTRFITFPDALAQVTAKEVQAVAKKYLIDDQSTVAWFVPIEEKKAKKRAAKKTANKGSKKRL